MRGLAGDFALSAGRRRSHRRSPRPVSLALDALSQRLQPASTLARVQAVWPRVVAALPAAAEANPSALRDDVLSVRCSAAVYAQELHLAADDLIAALNGALGEELVRSLRVRVGQRG